MANMIQMMREVTESKKLVAPKEKHDFPLSEINKAIADGWTVLSVDGTVVHCEK